MPPTDIRDTDPNATAHRKARFRTGWAHACSGQEYKDALDNLTWQNLGWRLGRLFGGTSAELIDKIYDWCVDQQNEKSASIPGSKEIADE